MLREGLELTALCVAQRRQKKSCPCIDQSSCPSIDSHKARAARMLRAYRPLRGATATERILSVHRPILLSVHRPFLCSRFWEQTLGEYFGSSFSVVYGQLHYTLNLHSIFTHAYHMTPIPYSTSIPGIVLRSLRRPRKFSRHAFIPRFMLILPFIFICPASQSGSGFHIHIIPRIPPPAFQPLSAIASVRSWCYHPSRRVHA